MTAALLAFVAGCGGAKEEAMTGFMLKSDAFADGGTLPSQFTCDGADQSPPLAWSEPPSGTRSFALIVDDPDAPSGLFRHWGAFNIPAGARNLSAGAGSGASEAIAQAQNDFGKSGYGGACPPHGHGPHHYRFKLLALDVDRLDLPSMTKIAQLESEAEKHIVGRAGLTGIYERK